MPTHNSSTSDDESSDNSKIEITGSDLDNSIAELSSSEEESIENENKAVGQEGLNYEDNEDDDDLVKAIKAAKETNKIHPPDINLDDILVDISFHPNNNLISVATVTGDVSVYKYSNDSNELLRTLELHTKACRAVEFSEDGSTLFSCGKDKSIMVSDVETGKLKKFYDNAHDVSLYSLYVFSEKVICTGDEEGTVKVWDIRLNRPTMVFKHMEDFVSGMVTNDSKKYLICSSGDGTITSYNMPSKKMFVQSEGYDAELNCLQLLKYECKLLTCSSKGKMYLFNWGEFGYHSDEYPGPKQAINSALAITENMVVLGYEDGNIRAVNFFPHSPLGIVGQHELSVESLDISHDGEFIASVGLDQKVKFWNIRYFEDLFVKRKQKKIRKNDEMAMNLPSSNVKNVSDFFGELN